MDKFKGLPTKQVCESCEKSTDIETMKLDTDANWFCENCVNEIVSENEIAKQGDTIQWSFPEDDERVYLRGNTFEAKVVIVNHKEKEYGVYSEYGQDFIGFDDCKIIKRK